jgi:hypothetical protein
VRVLLSSHATKRPPAGSDALILMPIIPHTCIYDSTEEAATLQVEGNDEIRNTNPSEGSSILDRLRGII